MSIPMLLMVPGSLDFDGVIIVNRGFQSCSRRSPYLRWYFVVGTLHPLTATHSHDDQYGRIAKKKQECSARLWY